MHVDPHQPLRDDVRLLGEVLGRVLRHHEGDEIFQRVEQVREAAKRARTRDSEVEDIGQLLREMPIGVGADRRARVRAFPDPGQHRRAAPPCASPARSRARSARAAAARLVRRDVRAIARRRRRGRRAVGRHRLDAGRAGLHGASHRDRSPHAAPETQPDCADPRVSRSAGPDAGRAGGLAARASARDRGGVADRRSAPRARVTPLDEVRAGLVVFEQSLWEALPQYLRAVDRALVETTGTSAAARGHADSIRLVDWRRSRRQPQHYARR